MRVTILGCGGSGGVPLIGGNWGHCDPSNPRNRRLRASILVEASAGAVVIDTSPDFRQQLLNAEVKRLDAVLYTHAHADHLHGIDDLRAVKVLTGRAIPIFGDGDTLAEIHQRFRYVLDVREDVMSLYEPLAEPHVIEGPFTVGDLPVVIPFEQDHGHSGRSLGYRIGPVAYSTDVVGLSEACFAALDGVELWIVDCLRERPHATHSHFAQTLDWIERVRPGRAVLTHMNHTLDYNALAAKCPPGVEPGYDGMVIEL
jgi:phosphoribosyl 1,2-cyclic phosphate phosphodiesterase